MSLSYGGRPDDWDIGYEEALDNTAYALVDHLCLDVAKRDKFLKACGVEL